MMILDRQKLERAMQLEAHSQGSLAAAAGLTRNTIVNALGGKPVRPVTLRKICNVLNVRPIDLEKTADAAPEAVADQHGEQAATVEQEQGAADAMLDHYLRTLKAQGRELPKNARY